MSHDEFGTNPIDPLTFPKDHPAPDTRSSLARARDRWFASEEGLRCMAGATEGRYLRNRLECAYMAGANFGNEPNRLEHQLSKARAALLLARPIVAAMADADSSSEFQRAADAIEAVVGKVTP